jgi:hypothetical protein
MEPQLFHSVRIIRDDPAQHVVAGAEGALVDWLDAPPGGEKGAIIELYDHPDDAVVTVPASWLEAVAESNAADNDPSAGRAKRVG